MNLLASTILSPRVVWDIKGDGWCKVLGTRWLGESCIWSNHTLTSFPLLGHPSLSRSPPLPPAYRGMLRMSLAIPTLAWLPVALLNSHCPFPLCCFHMNCGSWLAGWPHVGQAPIRRGRSIKCYKSLKRVKIQSASKPNMSQHLLNCTSEQYIDFLHTTYI